MKISLEWLSDYVDLPTDVTPAELAHQLTLKTVEVEDILTVDDDIVFEIDNKSLTNRPDLWGHYGIAREFATIYELALKPLAQAKRPEETTDLVGEVDTTIARRLAAVAFEVTDAGAATPPWMRRRLARIGEASINLEVDISNYVMFAVGQPTHAYDAERISLPLSVRTSGTQAKLAVLTGTVSLDASTPVIADASGPVAAAGVMGSAASAVHSGSRRFVLEAATFHAQPIRRASQHLGLRTEASARFEKGLDTDRVDQAIDLFLLLLDQIAPTSIVHAMQDVNLDPTPRAHITVGLDFLARRIGTTLPVDDIRRVLESLGFTVEHSGNELRVSAPTWRSTGDISLPHDIVEEVARIYGYDNLPVAPVTVALNSVRSLHRQSVGRAVREVLATRGGLQEVATYPWVADAVLAAAGWSKDETIRFEGAPAPDRDSLRPSLVPNLLEAAVENIPYADEFAIFEVGTVFTVGSRPAPVEATMLGGILVGSDGETLFRRAKGILELLRRDAHLTDLDFAASETAPWADQSARVAITAGGAVIGTLGLLTKRTKRMAGLTVAQVACFELDLTTVEVFTSRENKFEQLPELPDADFDLSVVIADDKRWADVVSAVLGTHPLVHRVVFVDEFRGAWVPDGHRSLTLRVTLRPQDVTLTAETIGDARTQVLAALADRTGARLRQ